MPDEYPKWVAGVVVDNAEQEAAVLEGRATFTVTRSAYGETRTISSIAPTPVSASFPGPLDEPAEMIAAVQETFTRRKSKRRQG